MSKITSNQHGAVAILEILIIFVVITLMGFTMWRVISTKNDVARSNQNAIIASEIDDSLSSKVDQIDQLEIIDTDGDGVPLCDPTNSDSPDSVDGGEIDEIDELDECESEDEDHDFDNDGLLDNDDYDDNDGLKDESHDDSSQSEAEDDDERKEYEDEDETETESELESNYENKD